MPKPWFSPKRHGYGAGLPVHWKGWVVTLGYMLAVILAALPAERDPKRLPASLLVVFLLTVGVTVIARRRTDGGWKWRSGNKDD